MSEYEYGKIYVNMYVCEGAEHLCSGICMCMYIYIYIYMYICIYMYTSVHIDDITIKTK